MSVEPIAIIGMGCRLPQAPDPEAYWRLLRAGRSAVSKVPASRWDVDALYSPEPRTPGKMHTRWGAFLDDPYSFDARFFKIMPIEAPRIDPQHRLVLEVAWEALENAGIDATGLAGSATGVYVGLSHSDHDRLLYLNRDLIDGYNGPDTYHSFSSNRLSYFLRLRGPSIAVDAACASSLTAVHLACQGLRGGDCDLALAGGVNLNLTPDEFIALSFLGVLSKGDTGRPFAAAADGYVRGEGCGIVVLKRFSDAVDAGDNILAVIRGSAINHNGLSNGITAPSGPAQEQVIRRAVHAAGVNPLEVTHVEAMGTGTNVGDPIEVAALAAVYGGERAADRTCWVSSVKANIGHLEAAAGVASLIKVVLSLQHGEVPPQPNIETLNPRIQLDGTGIDFPRTPQPWTAAAGKRVAGVSAFGFGGANAHLIVEGTSPPTATQSTYDGGAAVLTLSAQSGAALAVLARRYVDFLVEHPEAELLDVCFTTNTGRARFEERLAVVGASTAELRSGLLAYLDERPDPSVFTGSPVAHPRAEDAPAQRMRDAREAARRFISGEAGDWRNLYGEARPRRIPLPTYPFERASYRWTGLSRSTNSRLPSK